MVLDTNTLILVLLALLIVLTILYVRLERKLHRFLAGKDSKNLTESLTFLRNEIKDEHEFREEMRTYLTSVERRLQASVQHIETVRFNPFQGSGEGGNQSFATALLSERGTGVVLSSIFSRERVSVFSKPIVEFQSEFELSAEEKKVIALAKSKRTAPKK